jgi:hypothetical protein
MNCLRIACIVLSLFSPSVCMAGESAQDLLKKLQSPELDLDEKTAALEEFQIAELDENGAEILLGMTKNCDVKLIDPIVVLAAKKYTTRTLDVLERLVKSSEGDADRLLGALNSVMESPQLATLQGLEVISKAYIEVLEHALQGGKLSTVMPEAAQSKNLQYIIGSKPFLFKPLFLRLAAAPNTLKLGLGWLEHSYVAPVLRDEDIPALIDSLEKTSPEHAAVISNLLLRVTHSPGKRIEHPAAWRTWWNEQKGNSRILDAAFAAAADRKLDLKERRFALEQLRPGFLPENQLQRVATLAKTLVVSPEEPLEIREPALNTLVSSPLMLTDKNFRLETSRTLLELFSEPTLKWRVIEWLAAVEGLIETPEITAKLQATIRDRLQDLRFRAYVADILARKKPSPELSLASLEVLQDAEQTANLAASALKMSTGKDLGRKLADWRELLHGIPAPEPAPKALVEPGGMEPTDYQLTVHSIYSDSHIEFEKDNALKVTRTILLNSILKWPTTKLVAANTGYVIQEVMTDTGEKTIVDWQRTTQYRVEIQNWFARKHADTGNPAPGKADAVTEQRMIQLMLGSPQQNFSGLAKAKGYVVMKSARKIKQVDLKSPREWVGKYIDLPDLKELRIFISKLDGKNVQISHSGSFAKYMLLKKIEFLTGAGESIPWSLQGRPVVGDAEDALQSTLILDFPFPVDGIIVFHLYDDIYEERVPFELKNLRFDNGPIKPPAPPEF